MRSYIQFQAFISLNSARIFLVTFFYVVDALNLDAVMMSLLRGREILTATWQVNMKTIATVVTQLMSVSSTMTYNSLFVMVVMSSQFANSSLFMTQRYTIWPVFDSTCVLATVIDSFMQKQMQGASNVPVSGT